MAQESYALIEINGPKNSKVNPGSMYWTLQLLSIENNQVWKCQVDSSMRNFDQWVDIVNNPRRGYVLTNLRVKSKKDWMLNADSSFELRKILENNQELKQAVQELHNPSKFKDLFE